MCGVVAKNGLCFSHWGQNSIGRTNHRNITKALLYALWFGKSLRVVISWNLSIIHKLSVHLIFCGKFEGKVFAAKVYPVMHFIFICRVKRSIQSNLCKTG